MATESKLCKIFQWRNFARLTALALASFLIVWFALPWAIPFPDSLTKAEAGSPVLLDRKGRPIRHLVAADFTRSLPISITEIPPELIDCTLAAEDKRFRQHHGIDIMATIRSAIDCLRERRIVSGGSSVTQQLAKLTSPPAPRNLKSKIREALLARRIEMTLDKNQILEAYFAKLDYGNLRIGPKEAARFYFQKPLDDLSLGECALLAGLPQAPSWFNPIRHPLRAQRKRQIVLDRLEKYKEYDASTISVARTEKILLRPLLEKESAPWLNQNAGNTQTTIDLSLQEDIEQIVTEEVAKLKSSNLRHAAVVLLDNRSGEILAMVSSADWKDSRGGQIHGALSPRSPGSTLKPFTYLLGFRYLQHLPSTIIADIPTPLRTAQGLQLPENYDRRYRGPVTIRQALACSLNVPALRELDKLGGATQLYDFLKSLGISSLSESPDHYGLGLTIGNAPVKLLELANAYSTLARRGTFIPTKLFMSHEVPVSSQLIDPTFAWMISDILSDPQARAPSFSSGGPLDLPFRCAVKTGTSSDFRDNWCIGYTPEFTVGVWAGNFENQPMKNISGISGAGPIFHRVLVRAHLETPPTWYETPADGKNVSIDIRNGKRIPQGVDHKFQQKEWIPRSRDIAAATSEDYDQKGRAKLPAMYRKWFESDFNTRRKELVIDESSEDLIPLTIERPRDGAMILLDPEIPGNNATVKLVTNLPQYTSWSCGTLEIDNSTARLVPGTHTLSATDTRNGTRQRITILVEKL
ncbi:penicillin-binding protein 1C [Luteolibacter sp. AS25]|uniref:penicillin-binding protein 1C n=1 Tax=Luteolibacter sp. AS25 TaxID=3135776 RepID=UPI00398B5B33